MDLIIQCALNQHLCSITVKEDSGKQRREFLCYCVAGGSGWWSETKGAGFAVSEWCDSCMSFWLLGVEEECGGGGVRVFSLHFSLLRFAPTKGPGGDRFISGWTRQDTAVRAAAGVTQVKPEAGDVTMEKKEIGWGANGSLKRSKISHIYSKALYQPQEN